MGMEKPATALPSPTAENLFPPCRHHDYFSYATTHPLQAGASGFNVINACWLSEAALLAYDSDEEFVSCHCHAAGFESAQWFRGHSSQALLLVRQEAVVLAFRGTQVCWSGGTATAAAMLADWVTDVRTGLVASGGVRTGTVHEGFKSGLEQIWPALFSQVERLLAEVPGRTLWLTGHSLGAALATLAAQRFTPLASLYTFGSPMVGDAEFCKSLPGSCYRIVHQSDVITEVPWFGLKLTLPPSWARYLHVGHTYWMDEAGALHFRDGAGETSPALSPAKSSWQDDLATMLRFRLTADSFYHHSPLYYALRLRQHLASPARA